MATPPAPEILLRDNVILLSGVGLVRARQEDACAVSPDGTLLALSDGMGGYVGGDEASRAAVHAAMLRVTGVARRASTLPAPEGMPDDGDLLASAVRAANRKVLALAAKHPSTTRPPGATLVLAQLRPYSVTVAHVGDSRAYLLVRHKRERTNAKTVRRLTAGHAVRNGLTRCLGGGMNDATPDVATFPVQRGDAVLLCSDGLHGMVKDATIERLWLATTDPKTFARALHDAAMRAGGDDNCTLALAVVR